MGFFLLIFDIDGILTDGSVSIDEKVVKANLITLQKLTRCTNSAATVTNLPQLPVRISRLSMCFSG